MTAIAVIFDMDGVLVDSGAAHLESWRRLAAESGRAQITDEQFAATFGRRSSEIIEALFGVTEPGRAGAMDERKEAIYRDLIRGRVPAMPGAVELVTRLADEGVLLAVGSSGPPENIELVCDELGIASRLSAVVTGMDVNSGKPDPDVFLVAAHRLGLPPDRCVVVEDAPSGIEAARRAGMRCIGLTSAHSAEALRAADVVVGRLADISPERIRALVDGPAIAPHRGGRSDPAGP